MLRLSLAGPDTLVTSPMCARCPSGPAGCCAAPPALAWTDIGRIADKGGADWLLAEIRAERLRPCPRGLAISRAQGPHGLACTYLSQTGCALPPERRSVTCNEYLCEDALTEAEREGDKAAPRARAAHLRLEAALATWDQALSVEVTPAPNQPVFDRALFARLGAAFARIVARAGLAIALLLFALAAAGCAGLPANVPRGGAFDARRLEGGWTVIASNFPMWLEGEKTDPNFIYRVRPGTSPVELDDVVAYTQSGRRDTIEGTDTQDPSAPAHFTWRGNGLLVAFASDWVVMANGPDDRWLILYFSKTLATPEGVDVIAKVPVLTREDRIEIQKALAKDPFLSAKSAGLVWLASPREK